MDWLEILKYIAAIASGLAAAIPLVIQLVKYIKQAVKEKNWGVVLEKVMKLMETAETKFKDGAERKSGFWRCSRRAQMALTTTLIMTQLPT